MMENDDKMIRDFFASHKQKVVDDGFSAKVIKSLPYRVSPLLKIWGALVLFTAIVLFFIFDGWLAIIQSLRDVYVAIIQKQDFFIDPTSIIIAVVVLCIIGLRNVWSWD